ncbi:MAPEG family protein [Sphingomonas koreensis]|nr:MAPEG family protein [Sphingomonas koreensis]
MTDRDRYRREQRLVALAMALALAITVAALAVAIEIDRHGAPPAFADRLRAMLRGELLVVVWLAAAIANVARLRFFSPIDIAGSSAGDASPPVRQAGAILQNTLEQVVLALAAHLLLVATLDRSIAVLQVLVGLFCVGRLLFWIGYSRGAAGRALGFALTFYPSIAALLIAAGAAVAATR